MIVVVGAGLAGLRTVEALRDKGCTEPITLIGEEVHPPYDRPPLSKHVLRGERDVIWLRGADEWAELDVDLRLGVAATGVDLDGKVLATSEGPVAYDALVVATGAVPRRLPGAPGHVLRTLDDCRRLAPSLKEGATLAIVGAGLIGCEVAASARGLGVSVHVVDVLPAPVVRVLGLTVAERIRAMHEERGVVFHLGTGVARASAERLELTDGSEITCDVLLEAMGVVPATDWLGGALPVDDGVVCDVTGQAAPGVWAVGDVARWGGTRLEHWTSAGEQGALVAGAILGQPAPLDVAPYWWSDQYDVKLQGVGLPAADDDVTMLEVGARSRPLALYSRDGRVTAAVGFSAAAAVMKLRPAVADRATLEQARALVT